MKNFGNRIKALRRKMNLTQEELAERLNVSYQTISKWENYSAVPELDKIMKMSSLFGVTMDERICDGAYFAMAFARFKEYLADPTKLEGPSQHPVLREWAAPGDYELLKAKRDYEGALAEIKASALSKEEKRKARKEAKEKKRAAVKRAKQIKKEHKGEKPACV